MKKILVGVIIGIIVMSMFGCSTGPQKGYAIGNDCGMTTLHYIWTCPECNRAWTTESGAQSCIDRHNR